MQKEAMRLFNEIANSDAMKLSVRLERGDIALINNINVSALPGRLTAFLTAAAQRSFPAPTRCSPI
jgi:hypothetical protein